MKRLAKSVRYFLLALQFFTRIPVTGRLGKWVVYSPQALRKSSAYFPAIGWIVGAVTAFTYWIIAFNLPDLPATPLVAALLSTFVGLMLTGAFHEDGLADLTDGLGGRRKAFRCQSSGATNQTTSQRSQVETVCPAFHPPVVGHGSIGFFKVR